MDKHTQFTRTQMLYGDEAVKKLQNSAVLVFGLGGVGGHAAESLVRCGIGRIGILDREAVDITNLNRQTIATHDTVGQDKVGAMADRLLSINPHVQMDCYNMFYHPDTAAQIDLTRYDYLVECMDTVAAKIELIVRAKAAGVPILSVMGAANKLDPTALQVMDLAKTKNCALARVMRRELRRRGIYQLKVVCSTEKAKTPHFQPEKLPAARRQLPASSPFVPAVAGLIAASAVVDDLIG